jgi:hypothetical protein
MFPSSMQDDERGAMTEGRKPAAGGQNPQWLLLKLGDFPITAEMPPTPTAGLISTVPRVAHHG